MITKKIALFSILFILITLKVWATDFVVTSNADSGPGTLREALTLAAANGSATQDVIKFNLADVSEAGRTITLLTQLPSLSSNLIIDGSTQAGNKFGVSNAKVALFMLLQPQQNISCLRVISQTDVEIYGLYIKNITDPSGWGMPVSFTGFELAKSKNVQIGAAGKGNVCVGFDQQLMVNALNSIGEPYFENLVLKNNFWGVDVDGISTTTGSKNTTLLYTIVGQLTIGGTTDEGNIFSTGFIIHQNNYQNSTDPRFYYESKDATIIIKNNKIGVDHFNNAFASANYGIVIGTVSPNGKNTVNVEDNTIATSPLPGFRSISVSNIGKKVTILRNFIGTDKTLQKKYPTGGLFFYYASNVSVGSDDPADANYVTNCKPISVWPFSKVAFNKNSFFCTTETSDIYLINTESSSPRPTIAITASTAAVVSGTASPGSTIELFYSDRCGSCSPETYFGSTSADASGNWRYSGPFTGQIIASATLNGATSEFTQTGVNSSYLVVKSNCDGSGGSITGLIPTNSTSIEWIDANRTVISNSLNLINVPPGFYKLIAKGGNCSAETPWYEILGKLELDATLMTTKSSCASGSGEIKGIKINNLGALPPTYKWTDANGVTKGQTLDLLNSMPGSYTLTVTRADNCNATYGPVVILSVNGPRIDESNAVMTSNNCGQMVGSITGISTSGTGALKYSWKNEAQQEVATTLNLSGMPAGRYTLQVTDDSGCGPVFSSAFTITETNGITLNDAGKVITPSTCGNSNGSIKGITVTGATKYQWANANAPNTIISSTIDLVNASAGDYIFTASNSFGCERTVTYTIDMQTSTQYPNYLHSIHNACYGQSNGFINFTVNNLVKSLRWVNSQNIEVGKSAIITNLPPDTYRLLFKDANDCETLYGTYTVRGTAPLQIVPNSFTVINDACNQKSGSISGIQITGGTTPYTYLWRNAANDIISTTLGINGLGAGAYTLTVTDARSCEQAFLPITITNVANAILPPAANDVSVCSPGNVSISVQDPSASYRYRLYDAPMSNAPLQEQANGIFKISIKAPRSYYVSRFVGDCESDRTEVKISLGLSTLNIANAFTPNGDGINDFWRINGMENSPTAVVSVFNRSGQKLFESIGYKNPFDGTFKGKLLPAGTYYYMINTGGACSLLSGSLAIIR